MLRPQRHIPSLDYGGAGEKLGFSMEDKIYIISFPTNDLKMTSHRGIAEFIAINQVFRNQMSVRISDNRAFQDDPSL